MQTEEMSLNQEELKHEVNKAEVYEEESRILNSTISELSRAYAGMGNRAERRRISKSLKADVRKRRRNG